jgi:hypothetical protein
MSFTENLYLKNHLKKLQEENIKFKNILNEMLGSEKTAKSAESRIRVEELIRKIQQNPGHDSNLVKGALNAIKGRVHPNMLKNLEFKLTSHLQNLLSLERPAVQAAQVERPMARTISLSASATSPDVNNDGIVDELDRAMQAATLVSQRSSNTGTSSGY